MQRTSCSEDAMGLLARRKAASELGTPVSTRGQGAHHDCNHKSAFPASIAHFRATLPTSRKEKGILSPIPQASLTSSQSYQLLSVYSLVKRMMLHLDSFHLSIL